MGWGSSRAIVAGADLSGQQHKAINYAGVLTTSATNALAGFLVNKPKAGEHATVEWIGRTRVWAAASLGAGAYIGLSGATSGGVVPVSSGGFAVGISATAISSGYSGEADLFGGLSYIAL